MSLSLFGLIGKRALITGSSRDQGFAFHQRRFDVTDGAPASVFFDGHILYVDGSVTSAL